MRSRDGERWNGINKDERRQTSMMERKGVQKSIGPFFKFSHPFLSTHLSLSLVIRRLLDQSIRSERGWRLSHRLNIRPSSISDWRKVTLGQHVGRRPIALLAPDTDRSPQRIMGTRSSAIRIGVRRDLARAVDRLLLIMNVGIVIDEGSLMMMMIEMSGRRATWKN